jgi:hypothetical protein
MRWVSIEELVYLARGGLNLGWQLSVESPKFRCSPARSRARLKVVLCDLGKPLGVFGQIGFVAVQQLGQSWALAIVAGDPLPLCVTGKLWKHLRNVLKQLLAFRW